MNPTEAQLLVANGLRQGWIRQTFSSVRAAPDGKRYQKKTNRCFTAEHKRKLQISRKLKRLARKSQI